MAGSRYKRYKVIEITNSIKDFLEGEFYAVQIEGEVSGFKVSSNGHYYFSLKDSQASISAVLFSRYAKSAGYLPKDGDLVVVTGNLSVYAKSGNYQIICSAIEKAGIGDIFAELEKRKQRLMVEGLFDQKRKKAIPLYPKKVGVVTSPTGAAIRDILNVLGRRNNNIDLIILPAPVQGDEAAPKIAAQIRRANMFKMCDVLLVSRGGGAIEDLLPFSDEEVVRAVAESKIPTISAVGHEIDFMLCDFAADMRAPTPSAAAEMVSRETANLMEKIQALGENIKRSFERTFDDARQWLDDAAEDCHSAMDDILKEHRHRLELASSQLKASSPDVILKMGYAAVLNKTSGNYAASKDAIKNGDKLDIKFWDGTRKATADNDGELL